MNRMVSFWDSSKANKMLSYALLGIPCGAEIACYISEEVAFNLSDIQFCQVRNKTSNLKKFSAVS